MVLDLLELADSRDNNNYNTHKIVFVVSIIDNLASCLDTHMYCYYILKHTSDIISQ